LGLILLLAILVFLGVVLLLLAFLGLRNNLVRERNELGKAWANLDQLLKRRRDELPRLIGTCRSYLSEQGLFDSIAAARAAEQKATPPEQPRAAAALTQGLNRLFAMADRNRELSLDTSYRQLKKQILILEERIVAEQERFRAQANAYNARLRGFTGGLAGRAAGLRQQPAPTIPPNSQN